MARGGGPVPVRSRPTVEYHARRLTFEALMTDFSGERYWTLVAEFETPGMAEFEKMMQGGGMSEADTKEFERLMQGYHDLIDSGHREIYRLEPATKG